MAVKVGELTVTACVVAKTLLDSVAAPRGSYGDPGINCIRLQPQLTELPHADFLTFLLISSVCVFSFSLFFWLRSRD